MPDFTEAQNRLTETSYKTEAWHYRHAVVSGLILFFSLFYLAFKGIIGGIAGCISGIVNAWTDKVSPFMKTINKPASSEPTIPSAT